MQLLHLYQHNLLICRITHSVIFYFCSFTNLLTIKRLKFIQVTVLFTTFTDINDTEFNPLNFFLDLYRHT